MQVARAGEHLYTNTTAPAVIGQQRPVAVKRAVTSAHGDLSARTVRGKPLTVLSGATVGASSRVDATPTGSDAVIDSGKDAVVIAGAGVPVGNVVSRVAVGMTEPISSDAGEECCDADSIDVLDKSCDDGVLMHSSSGLSHEWCMPGTVCCAADIPVVIPTRECKASVPEPPLGTNSASVGARVASVKPAPVSRTCDTVSRELTRQRSRGKSAPPMTGDGSAIITRGTRWSVWAHTEFAMRDACNRSPPHVSHPHVALYKSAFVIDESVMPITDRAMFAVRDTLIGSFVTAVGVIRAEAKHAVVREKGAIVSKAVRAAPAVPIGVTPWPPSQLVAETADWEGTRPVIPQTCVSCKSLLRWPVMCPRAYSTTCDTCMMQSYVHVRHISPAMPTTVTVGASGQLVSPTLLTATVERNVLSIRPNSYLDYRYAMARVHPEYDSVIVLTRLTVSVAVMSLRQAQYIRALLLESWPELSDEYRVNEADVHAAMVALCVTTAPENWPFPRVTRFRGDQHQFASWQHMYEPGFGRLAELPPHLRQLSFGEPSVSAYTPVDTIPQPSPLSADGHRALFNEHPAAYTWYNSLRVGFPLHAVPARRYRKASKSQYSSDPRIAVQEKSECAAGWIRSASEWPTTQPIILNDWFAAHTGGKYRGVLNLSCKGGPNHTTRRLPQLRAQLASWRAVAQRVLYLRNKHPGERIMAFTLDLEKAFRQVPVALNQWWMLGQLVSGERHVNARLPLGGTCSVDTMTLSPVAMMHAVAEQWDIFLQVYVDDILAVDVESKIHVVRDRVRYLLSDVLHWPFSEPKCTEPATKLVFLGVLLDLDSCTLAVTPKRMNKLMELLQGWQSGAIRPTQRRLASLAGTLNFVSAVIPFGKVFTARLRAIGDSANGAISPDVIATVQYNVRWWQLLLSRFNGVASFAPLPLDTAPLHLTTDAAAAGWGAVCTQRDWWAHGRWSQRELDEYGIAQREAAAIVLGFDVATAENPPVIVVAHTDSIASHFTFAGLRTVDERMLNVLRVCALLQLERSTRLLTTHIRGVDNPLSDVASRKHALPDCLSYLQLRHPSARVRSMVLTAAPPPPPTGLSACTDQSCAPSQGPSHQRPQEGTSTSTAGATATSPTRPFPWILWNQVDWATVALDGFFT